MIRLAVIGAGRWGPNLARNFDEFPDVELLGIVDPNQEVQALCKKSFPNTPLFENVDQLLEEVSLDAVVIATPVNTHFELGKKCLERGLHVFMEKPLCHTSQEIQALEKISQEKKLILMVDHVFLYNLGIQKVKKIIDSGNLGKIVYLKATRTNLGPVRLDVNALWDLASHDLSIFNWWLDGKPQEVSATGVTGINQNIEDVVFGTFNYPSDVICQVHASWLNPQKVREIIVVGQDKMLVWNDLLESPVSLYHKGILAGDQRTDSFSSHRTVVHSGEIEEIEVEPSEPLKNACRHFIECINGTSQCLSGSRQAYDVVQSLEAADRSLKNNGTYVSLESH